MKRRSQFGARRRLGFTLVELLIVVIILGVLAAVVVPQFGATTETTKLTALDADLSGLRQAIQHYYVDHGNYPGDRESTGGGSCGGSPGTGAARTAQAFLDQLALFTKSVGHACTQSGGPFLYGPYLRRNSLPENPFTGSNALLIVAAGALDLVSVSTVGGWKFDVLSGRFIADHSAYDER